MTYLLLIISAFVAFYSVLNRITVHSANGPAAEQPNVNEPVEDGDLLCESSQPVIPVSGTISKDSDAQECEGYEECEEHVEKQLGMSVLLRSRSDAKKAFICSEIFNRKY